MNFPSSRKDLDFSEAEGKLKLFAKIKPKSQLEILKDMKEQLLCVICIASVLQNCRTIVT